MMHSLLGVACNLFTGMSGAMSRATLYISLDSRPNFRFYIGPSEQYISEKAAWSRGYTVHTYTVAA